MAPSFGKIPEMEVPPVLKTWKMCLLNHRGEMLTFKTKNARGTFNYMRKCTLF